MTANVTVLATSERVRDALAHIQSARVSLSFGSGKTYSMIVALLTDLDQVQCRLELEKLVAHARNKVPIVLMSTSAMLHRDAAFQAMAHLTWLIGREVYVAPDAAAVSRMVFARQVKAEQKLIASATVEDGRLVVWSCEPRRYVVSASEIPALAKLTPAALVDFEVSETGSRIHWKSGDVDLDLDSIRAYADPEVRRRHEAERRNDAVRYAAAIRKFREDSGLRQTDIHGLSERQVRRLEEGETLPHSSTLRKLAVAHGMSIDEYLRELAKRDRSHVDRRKRHSARKNVTKR